MIQLSRDPHGGRSQAPADLIGDMMGHARGLIQLGWRLADRELSNSAGHMPRAASFFVRTALLGLMALGLPGWLAALQRHLP